MNFTRPTHPIRRFVLSFILGMVFVGAFYFLWIKPEGEIQHITATRTTQNIGFFHAWKRHDRWLMEPVATQGLQIGLPTFAAGRGMNLTIALTFTLLIAECLLYHIATEPWMWRKMIATKTADQSPDPL